MRGSRKVPGNGHAFKDQSAQTPKTQRLDESQNNLKHDLGSATKTSGGGR